MREKKLYYVYIMGSISGTLYIGMTNGLERRIMQHKEHAVEGFTDDYEVERLLYFEAYDDVHKAIAREKQLKGWIRAKKVALIEKLNPTWKDLAKDFAEGRGPSTLEFRSKAATFARSG